MPTARSARGPRAAMTIVGSDAAGGAVPGTSPAGAEVRWMPAGFVVRCRSLWLDVVSLACSPFARRVPRCPCLNRSVALRWCGADPTPEPSAWPRRGSARWTPSTRGTVELGRVGRRRDASRRLEAARRLRRGHLVRAQTEPAHRTPPPASDIVPPASSPASGERSQPVPAGTSGRSRSIGTGSLICCQTSFCAVRPSGKSGRPVSVKYSVAPSE